jgi:uroporphyrinogen-III synthase
MRALEGWTIALLESRRGAELAALVRQAGGTPVSAPSVQEMERPDEVRRFAGDLTAGRFDLVVFLTGTGVNALLNDARQRGVFDKMIAALRYATIACRGPKPLAALKRHGLTPLVTTAKPHTSGELLDALTQVPLDGHRVALVHYGERSAGISEELRGRGAVVDDVCAYEWALPADERPLIDLIEQVVAGRVDALLVTSQIQFRNLRAIARQGARDQELAEALRGEIVIGAIGPICATAIREAGVIPDVMPAAANLPSLVRALADYFELTDGPEDGSFER